MSLLAVLGFATLVAAHDNGMDMSMDGAMDLAVGQMLPYLHFTPGDMLWFLGWVPSSAGTMVGTCIGLFLLGIVERWIAACAAVMHAHWAKRAQILQSNRQNAKGLPVASYTTPASETKSGPRTGTVLRDAMTMRTTPPFIASHDILRGIVYAGRAALQFAFMLAIMTFQVGFILSIVVGLGVGEMLFGRHIASASHIA
ncbi:CTR copper uptake transporter [Irpex rosettiformis]|uniref:CTR copper uptake transporter n=1 Tax=Irpex rosettiformis TaxID=378272 RepID=A0ACB8TU61_9APHY|nr:CTR copper uptake transporter [Irpex rosettiformis]